MTRLVLEISNQSDLDLLLPLFKRLRIQYSNMETPVQTEAEIADAIRIVSLGCDMSTFGDALQYQIETREERSLPFRD